MCVYTWRIPWTEEPGGLQSMGLQRVGTTGHSLTHIESEIARPCDSLIINIG